MTPREQEAITALCLMAALADGTKSDAERAKLREVFDGLEIASAPAVYQRVLLKKTDLAAEAAELGSPRRAPSPTRWRSTSPTPTGRRPPRRRSFSEV